MKRDSLVFRLLAAAGDWGVILALVVLWQLAVWSGLLRASAFPAPSTILTALFAGFVDSPHVLFQATLHTLGITLVGFAIALFVGIPLGLLMGLVADVRSGLGPLVALALPLPAVVIIPALNLWLPSTTLILIVVVAFAAALPLLKASETGARSLRPVYFWVARSLGASRAKMFWEVVLPGTLVQVLPAVSVAMGYAWRAIVAAEFITLAKPGLGSTIFAARQFNDVPIMYGGVVVIGFVGFALERGILGAIERTTLLRWGLIGAAE
jgi:ABC-type nitrate/sulfonate/bicarbonate transport system permease component